MRDDAPTSLFLSTLRLAVALSDTMKLPVVMAVGLLGPLAGAHTLFTTLFINGKNQGDGTCVRMPHDSATANGPVQPITGDDMACGESLSCLSCAADKTRTAAAHSHTRVEHRLTCFSAGRDGEKPVAFTCPAPREATLTFEFRMYSTGMRAGVIADDHKGPCAVYVKKVHDMYADKAAGPGWFKIWEDGYDAATDKWCVDRLIDAKGLLSVQLPAGLPAGYYLVRPEILALHNAAAGDAQFFLGCAQVFVEEGPRGALEIPREHQVSIPGHVAAADAGLWFSIWRKPVAAYPMPGPSVYVPGAAGGGGAAVKLATAKLAQGQGVVPSDCLVKNANWCGRRLAKHSDQRGCWAAVADCYRQSQTCWDGAPPSGDANCGVWQGYCREAESGCQAGRFEGPPGFTGQEKMAEVPGEIPAPWNDAFGARGGAASTTAAPETSATHAAPSA